MVVRIEQVQKQVEDGNFTDAYNALDDILALGPTNMGALKLKALLLSSEGKFSEEAEVWRKILSIDEEDTDAIEYFQRTATEQREHEFFSDLLPSGGIRFLANPKAVVNSSFVGVMGCAIFLTLMNFSHHYTFLAKPLISYISFSILVVLPWILILFVYFRALKDITIDRESIHLRTRLSDYELRWQDIQNFYLVRRSAKGDDLFILLLPKLSNRAPVLIKIGGSNTVVRSPSFLVREITRVFHEPVYETLENVKLPQKPTIFS